MNKSKSSYHKSFPENPIEKERMRDGQERTGDGDVIEHLIHLPFLVYARLIGLLLERLGYQNVQLAGRMNQRGRNKDGGADLIASLPGGVASRKVVIQVKQFDGRNRIFQKHLDELRGVALRHKASEAVLVTTGEISPAIDVFALDDLPVPVRLIRQDALLRLLKQHEIPIPKEKHKGRVPSFILRLELVPERS
jgi:restriction endonuclease Mrr